MKMKLLLAAVIVAASAFTGCDLGINPLIFDAPAATAKFRVDETVSSSFDNSAVVDLEEISTNIDADIDSVKVFNITLQIDSTAGTSPATTISGSALVDGNPLLTLSGTAISQFASERSIFDSTLAGGPVYMSAGVQHLISVLRQRPLPAVTVRAFGTASGLPLHFTIRLRVYAQIFTPAPK
jgi:hypothetical protein